MASSAPYRIETTASTMTTGAAHRDASGNAGGRSEHAEGAHPSSTPTRRIGDPGRACSAASGSQVWTDCYGALTAKAKKNPPNIRLSVIRVARGRRGFDEEALGPPGPYWYRAITPHQHYQAAGQREEQDLHRRVPPRARRKAQIMK